jgi:hypothetical protein
MQTGMEDYRLKCVLDLKNWFCGKPDDELAQYLITQLINGGECSDIFLRSLPETLRKNWIITLQLLAGKKVLFPLGTEPRLCEIFVEMQIRYKNCAHHELNRIRAEFCKHVDSFAY